MAATCPSQYCTVDTAWFQILAGDLIVSSMFSKPAEAWPQTIQFRNKYIGGFLFLAVCVLGLYHPYRSFFFFSLQRDKILGEGRKGGKKADGREGQKKGRKGGDKEG